LAWCNFLLLAQGVEPFGGEEEVRGDFLWFAGCDWDGGGVESDAGIVEEVEKRRVVGVVAEGVELFVWVFDCDFGD
jgi:hypothetical protein